jgi:hypothetical protein
MVLESYEVVWCYALMEDDVIFIFRETKEIRINLKEYTNINHYKGIWLRPQEKELLQTLKVEVI